MQYAFVNNIRKEAAKNSQGVCPICGADMIAKCGSKIIHHWAHKHPQNCDPWWENETQWHRDWKNLFPEECREVSHTASNGEIHRADVITKTGIVIEIQNSPINDIERKSREDFYKNMLWIVNGEKFEQNFDFYHSLPDPNSKLAQDLVWIKAKRGLAGANEGLFWRRSQNPNVMEGTGSLVAMEHRNEIMSEIQMNPSRYFQFDWVRPRTTWLDSNTPVFIDFGKGWLALLCDYPTQKYLPCIKVVTKKDFLDQVNTQKSASDFKSEH